jgi:WD40 repeat protein/tRNA A-37 threonylcarbamoyl transferase component Bud32
LLDGASEVLCPVCALRSVADGAAGLEPEPEPASESSAAGEARHGLAGPPPRSPLPRSFGDYELIAEIARGGMGVVYRARQRSLNRVVALKMVVGGQLASAAAIQRFRLEAQTAAGLQHPNIVVIHEVGEVEGQPFFAMDYVEGQNLAQVISDPRFPISDFRRTGRWVKTIAEAVHYAHQRGVIHRDLKPSNILIDQHDQPRITDFGVAKRLSGTTDYGPPTTDLTLTGQVLGSPNFMAPEQAQGRHREVGPASDVYSIGALLYHLLTGRPPFQAATLTEVLRQVALTDPVAPRLLNPGLPVDLETICLKCLEKDVPRRYPTAQALADELDRFLRGEPILARPIGLAGKVGKWCRRQPVRAGLVAALMVVFALGLSGVLWQWWSARLHAQREARERHRAESGELVARRNAYAADMKEAQRALQESNLGGALELLNKYRPAGKAEIRPAATARQRGENPKSEVDVRGWEWRYLWARCQSDERFTLCQYSNAVTALAFSPDGKWLAVRRSDDTVAVWDTVSRRSVAELAGAGYYKDLAFSPQGNLLAWGNEDTSGTPVVSLWDVSARRETARFRLPADFVSIAFSPDARAIAALTRDGAVHICDVESETVLTNFTTATVNVRAEPFSGAVEARAPSTATETVGGPEAGSQSVQPRGSEYDAYFGGHYGVVLFSPDGRWLAVGEVKPRIRLLDRIRGEETVIPVPVPSSGIAALAFSPDSKRLAAGCGFEDHEVHVWDLEATEVTNEVRLAGHSGCIVGLAFSPDGRTLASVSTDQTLRLWDVARKAQRRRFQGHTEEVWAVAWSPDGLATGGQDGSVRYWDPAAAPARLHAVLDEPIGFWGPVFMPDGRSLLAVTQPGGSVVRWSLEWKAMTLRRQEEMSWLGTNHTSVDLSRDGRWLALGDEVGNIQVWDYPGRRFVTNLVSPGRSIFGLMFSPSGNILHCGTEFTNGRLAPKLYAVNGWREIELRGVNLENIREVDLSPDERTLAAGYGDGTVAWWDLATGQRQPLFCFHDAIRVQVAFSADGHVFAAGSAEGQMRVWDVATRRVMLIVRGHGKGPSDLALSSDGRRLLASGTNPNELIRVWDVETGREVATLPGEPGLIYHMGFSPDASTLFATSGWGTALLWRAPSWEEIEAAERRQKAP